MKHSLLGQGQDLDNTLLGQQRNVSVVTDSAAVSPTQTPAVAQNALRSKAEAEAWERGPSFRAMFGTEPHRNTLAPEQVDQQIHALASRLETLQPGYQPVYGFTAEFPGKRVEHLERNVTLVHEHFKNVQSKHQVRILDVGCNSGYVALRLAETYPNVVGLEIAQPSLQLCRLLAARAESPARFFSDNLIAMLDVAKNDLENVDLVLLYNVVHQFIFAHGLQRTQALLAKLAASVDTVIVELARQEDYIKHGKDHLLPADPALALAGCVDIEITRLRDRPRPVFKLQRKTVRIGALEIRPEHIAYSLNPNPRVSRKYYSGDGKFLKLYRFHQAAERGMFEREVAALVKLECADQVPKLLGSAGSAHFGAVLMSQVHGERLVSILYNTRKVPLSAASRLNITRQYLEIARVVHESVGYQNDMQAHNLLVRTDGGLMLVDFEQAGHEPTNDPFGLLLWSVFDFWGGRDKERPAAIRSLRQPPEGSGDEVASRRYPDFAGLAMPPLVASLVNEAAQGGNWGAFVATWAERLSRAAGARTAAQ